MQKGLSVWWHTCPQCGTSLHRDHNAALNIMRLGQALSQEQKKGPGMALRGGVAVAASENRESA
jgi:putative transposase